MVIRRIQGRNCSIFSFAASTLFQLEQCDRTITLCRLGPVLKKLKVSIVDVLGEGKK